MVKEQNIHFDGKCQQILQYKKNKIAVFPHKTGVFYVSTLLSFFLNSLVVLDRMLEKMTVALKFRERKIPSCI